MSKKTVLKIVTLIFLIGIIIFIIPKTEYAVTIDGGKIVTGINENKVTVDNVINGTTINSNSKSGIFENKFIFCMEHNQSSKGTYKADKKYEIINDNIIEYKFNNEKKWEITNKTYTNKEKLFAQKVAYILSQIGKTGVNQDRGGGSEWEGYSFSECDDVQLALWKFLHEHPNETSSVFDSNCGDVKVEEHKDGECLCIYDSKWYGNENNKINVHSRKAYEIYDAACKLNSFSSKTEIYRLNAGDGQNLLLVKMVEEKPPINLTISKTDSLTTESLNGATFDIILENVVSIDKYSSGSKSGKIIISGAKTGEESDKGKIKLEGIMPSETGNVKITIKEKTAPTGYRKYEKAITIYVKHDGSQYSYDNETWENISNGNINIPVPNQPLITLSGNVWQDAQIGEKNVSVPNGKKDNGEKGIDGVLVQLYSLKDNKVVGDPQYTKNGGQYEFKDIEKTNEGYKILFSYDGINYKETKTWNDDLGKEKNPNYGKDSKASEVKKERTDFNKRFTTISSGQSNDGTPLTYDYEGNKARLKVNMDGTNLASDPASKDKNFRMKAQTGTYKNTDTNINCGLVEKEVDLGTVMTVDSTTLKINDKTTKYDYRKSLGDNLKDLDVDNLIEETRKNTITTYLETSDYYYRIEDYNRSNDEIKNEDATDIYNAADRLKELRAFVTYKVDLINQTANSGVTVNELAYYYDKNYTLVGIGKTVDGITGEAINDTSLAREPISGAFGKSAIKVSNINATSGNASVIQSLYFTFEVNKIDKDGDGIKESLPDEIDPKNGKDGLDCANIVEITSYSTNDSLIDRDSAPGNLVDGRTDEDDTSQSNGLKIVLKTTDRTIKGTVFADTNKDGILDENDTKVNNVIVQLIEIRSKASGGLGEYIWQQTVSGSNEVASLTNNGKTIRNYTYEGDNVVGDGEYRFTGFIPGNYIIRYIYGDGTTYDFDKDGKIAKYNGQDYKSTKDPNYTAELFNTAEYTTDSSVARDNEARRLEVMAYSTMIDSKIGEALNALDKKVTDLSETEKNILNEYYDSLDKNNIEVKYALTLLKNFTNKPDITFDNISDENKYKLIKYYVSYKTWMAAETSRINVPIDSNTTSIDANSTTVGLEYSDNKVTFDNVNFGLAERPKTNLVLEKHITGLKITPNGTGVQSIVDAKADIEKIVNGTEVGEEGVTTGLATIKSTRSNRGFWQVATDIEELAQGAQLEVEYTYVIRNDSEADYLSKELVDSYKNDPSAYASELLKLVNGADGVDGVRKATKGHTDKYGKHLGDFYYTGTKGNNDELVSSRIETLQEALNNDLTFDSAGTDFKKVNENAVTKKVYTVEGTNQDPVDKEIATVVQNNLPTDFLIGKSGDNYTQGTDVDYSKTITLKTVLSSSTGGELGANIPSYIAEVVKYSNAAGRRDMDAEPENLSYVHSDDSGKTMENSNEPDEFWGETIIIGKPFGEDKLTPIQIAIITVSSMALIGVGIVLIKKFVLKK